MFGVLIVDDEYYFREALKISLPWEELGFSICGEAKNGEEALVKIQELMPDIVLVDINMPVMDGLELVGEMKNRGLEAKTIIITGYSEFDYARQAVQLGVRNYILKPINENDLKYALLSLKTAIEKEKKAVIEIENLRVKVKESIPVLREKFINDLICGNKIWSPDEVERKLTSLNIDLISPGYKAIVMEIDDWQQKGWTGVDLNLWQFAVVNVADEVFQESFLHASCLDQDERICHIIGIDGKPGAGAGNGWEDGPGSAIEEACERIRVSVEKYLGFTITIGIGTECTDLKDAPISYREALVALKYRLLKGKNKVIAADEVNEMPLSGNPYPPNCKSELLMNLRTGNSKEAFNIISQIFREFERLKCRYEMVCVKCLELIATGHEFLAEISADCSETPFKYIQAISEIQQMKSLTQMEAWVREIFEDLLAQTDKNSRSRSSKVIQDIKNYIHMNYSRDDFRTDEICRHVYINYSHLCYIFKRETGMTLIDYLTEIRMQEAKRLIDNGNHSVSVVAAKVGYSDSNYFGKCFKKTFGVSPSRYVDTKLT